MSTPSQTNIFPPEFVTNNIDVIEPTNQGSNHLQNNFVNHGDGMHTYNGYNITHHQLSRPKQYNLGEIYTSQPLQHFADHYSVDYCKPSSAIPVISNTSPTMDYQNYMLLNTQQLYNDTNTYPHHSNPAFFYNNHLNTQFIDNSQSQDSHLPPGQEADSRKHNSIKESQGSSVSSISKGHSRNSSSNTVQIEYPEPIKPKIATTYWDDQNTLCYQVKARGILVSRREDTDFINGTKLLNVIGMTRGKRDGMLKAEKIRTVVKVGSMNLKGVWIPFERAQEIARNEGLDVVLYPLFVKNLREYYNSVGYKLKTGDANIDVELDNSAI